MRVSRLKLDHSRLQPRSSEATAIGHVWRTTRCGTEKISRLKAIVGEEFKSAIGGGGFCDLPSVLYLYSGNIFVTAGLNGRNGEHLQKARITHTVTS